MPTRLAAPPIAPRKRPSQRRSAATVEAILEGAARILEERGLAGFNTNAVAERAGVGVGSLYQYFPGKDALLAALIRRGWADLLDGVRRALAPQDGLVATLDRLVSVAVEQQAARPRLARVLDFEQQRLPLDAETAALAGAIGVAVAGLLARYAAELPGIHPAEAAADLATIARALVDRDGEQGVPDPAGLRRRVRRAVFGYLGLRIDAHTAG